VGILTGRRLIFARVLMARTLMLVPVVRKSKISLRIENGLVLLLVMMMILRLVLKLKHHQRYQ
jgi:hypothetical protein